MTPAPGPDPRAIPPAPDELEISVLGPGTGESIVVHLPGIGWGIVDGCRDTQGYLDLLAIHDLAFVALTHPHRDHYQGLDRILSARPGRVARVWISAGKSVRELHALRTLQNEHGRGDLHGLTAVLAAVRDARAHGADHRTMSACKPMLRGEYAPESGAVVPIAIDALSPSADDEEAYFGVLARATPLTGEVMGDLPDRAHNLIAAALVLSIGPWTVCLGSDVEIGAEPTMGWRAIVSDGTRPPIRAQLVKVSHHGSSNAHLDTAWDLHAGGVGASTDHAVVAPFASQRLPRHEDLERLRGRTRALHVTAGRVWMDPDRALQMRIAKHAHKLRNWRMIDERLGQVRYRASVLQPGALRVETFGRASDAT